MITIILINNQASAQSTYYSSTTHGFQRPHLPVPDLFLFRDCITYIEEEVVGVPS
ncbi:hypothetical protein RhiirA5_362822 [Rhizophagus irregularis]|uniref:Uncharacterized protein n=1 Tax=Rhizophagus irregularis TaxID=588596 RepID=A0A2N0PAU3_9GLOM|nr:hypothetical protein RhiirA5_362822 [Rhizophagus irregularis]